MKKILVTLISVILLFALTGCGEIGNAEKAVKGTFETFKASDMEKVSKYLDMDSMEIGDEESGLSTALIFNNLFSKLEYEIVSSEKIDSDAVIVKTKITALELEPMMQKFIASVMEFSFANMDKPELSEDETMKMYEDFFVKTSNDSTLAKKTEEIDIMVVKKDGKWMIQPDEIFAAAILGQ
ncbi:MAG: hypothetical protein WBH44_07240 [Proteocatella sp.]